MTKTDEGKPLIPFSDIHGFKGARQKRLDRVLNDKWARKDYELHDHCRHARAIMAAFGKTAASVNTRNSSRVALCLQCEHRILSLFEPFLGSREWVSWGCTGVNFSPLDRSEP